MCVCVRACARVFTNPLRVRKMGHKVTFKRSCQSKVKKPSLTYYSSIAEGRIIEFMPFPRVLALCEMQTASARVWTRVAVSISNDDNHCSMHNPLPDMQLLIEFYSEILTLQCLIFVIHIHHGINFIGKEDYIEKKGWFFSKFNHRTI